MKADQVILAAIQWHKAIPAFNIPYLPMVKPVVQAIVDENSIAMLDVARIEWEKFSAVSLEAVAEEYHRFAVPGHTLLHLDHIPVIDEDGSRVEYLPLLQRAIRVGYQSVMIDGSRLSLEENIRATAEVAAMAHDVGIACEGELGAVMGHEAQPLCSYEEIFSGRIGFTKKEEAAKFASESKCDWLSVAAGNIHGAVAESLRHQKKPEARLDIPLIREIHGVTGLPIVLHGGSGIRQSDIDLAIAGGIGKINVGTEIRQVYEQAVTAGMNEEQAQKAVYDRTRIYLSDVLHISGIHTTFALDS